ncbi:EamA family transporter [Massilia sp. IC2-476]|uniref:EamA family transporter n=1 Tax=Massilia sp. IC2-476 TaxID=2887199 RepID=UPI001D109EB1|nr:EamA family transporter [Massilia sp. IC2-476]MCC2972561.1 DMT family transporter [Massilia sp. IC2-476]
MPGLVLAAVLCAALLHAAWNAAIKAEPDKLRAAGAVTLGAALLGAASLPYLAAPLGASWPYIAGSAALHLIYYRLLAATYRDADFSHAYPLIRGAAPVLVALANSGSEALHPAQALALGLVFAGGAVVCVGGGGLRASRRTLGLALLTAVIVAACTLVDGLGVRRSGAPAAYTAWLFLLTGLGVTLTGPRRLHAELGAYVRARPLLVLGGGIATVGSYGIALWAMTMAPIAVVAALRETSIVFAAAIAAWVLRERVGPARIAGAVLIAGGAAVLRLA